MIFHDLQKAPRVFDASVLSIVVLDSFQKQIDKTVLLYA